MPFTAREQVVKVVNRLFYYTDHQLWDKLKAEGSSFEVYFDMTPLGAPKPEIRTTERICENGEKALKV